MIAAAIQIRLSPHVNRRVSTFIGAHRTSRCGSHITLTGEAQLLLRLRMRWDHQGSRVLVHIEVNHAGAGGWSDDHGLLLCRQILALTHDGWCLDIDRSRVRWGHRSATLKETCRALRGSRESTVACT